MDPTAELLSQLNDIETPASTGLGIAPGWFVLALLAIAVVIMLMRLLRKRRAARALDWRPAARQELEQIRTRLHDGQDSTVLADCSRLARRVALAVTPRADVAALSGEAWLQKLDEISGKHSFTQGVGSILATGPYQPTGAVDQQQLRDLVTAVEELVAVASQNTPEKNESRAA